VAFDRSHTIDLPDKLVPVFEGKARFRGAHGGRGSGKTRSFAKMSAVIGAKAAQEGREGVILCARQFMNSLADSSFSEVAAAIRDDPWLSEVYEIGETFIRTRCRRVEYLFIGLARNLSSIKSKARVLLCWVDEAEDVSEAAWIVLIPTVREDGSEIWVTWNPRLKASATNKRFRSTSDADMKIVELNWRDNPWFPGVLETERQRDKRDRPELYDHIWEGAYATAATGAYYAANLLQAKQEGRICKLVRDPLLPVYSHHDIGGRGARADNYVIWISQRVGREIRVLDHYNQQGQPLSAHAQWMRERGYGAAHIVLPHDGGNKGGPVQTWEDAWREAGFRDVRVIPNQGEGAAMYRIEQTRRHFGRVLFNEDTTEDGRIMLGLYAPKISEETGADRGPNHDYSHDADAFGLMMCDYTEPKLATGAGRRPAQKRSATSVV
jgi:phage terminase large subunit